MSGQDPLAVCAACLAGELLPLIEQRNRQIAGANHFQDRPAGVLETVAADAGVRPRRLYDILNYRVVTVGLDIADGILLAFDRPDLLSGMETIERPMFQTLGDPGFHVCTSRRGEPVVSVPEEIPVLMTPGHDKVPMACPKCHEVRYVRSDYARRLIRKGNIVCKTCSNRVTADVWSARRVAPGNRPVEAAPLASGTDGGTSVRGANSTERRAA